MQLSRDSMNSQSAFISHATPKRWSFWRRYIYEFFTLTFPPIFKRLFKVEIYGIENIPPEGQGVLLAANHVSFLDGFLVPISLVPLGAIFFLLELRMYSINLILGGSN